MSETRMFVQVNTTSLKAKTHPVGYTVQPDGCWRWEGAVNVAGYGRWERGGEYLAHRTIYVALRGPIPTGLEIDHLCRNRRCVNPDHLEPVSHRQNNLRGASPSALSARRTHCVNGHHFDHANTYVCRDGTRKCRACNRLRARVAYHAKREAA